MTEQDGRNGFTLLEVLVSLALLGFVLAALGGGIRFGARAWEEQDRRVASAGAGEAVYAVLRHLIEGAQPLPFVSGDGTIAFAIDGRSDRLDFVSALPAALGTGGLYDLQLALLDDGRLVLRWRPHRHVMPGHNGPAIAELPMHESDLARGVTGLGLRYYLPPSPPDPGGWLSDWRRRPTMPALLGLQLQFAPGRAGIALLAGPKVAVP
jgi:prepilin-type N-terminal cleavage/methylation domain-containing protein